MIGDVEVSSLKGAMDVRWLWYSYFCSSWFQFWSSFGSKIKREWRRRCHQLSPESLRLLLDSTIASLVKPYHKRVSTPLLVTINLTNYSRYVQQLIRWRFLQSELYFSIGVFEQGDDVFLCAMERSWRWRPWRSRNRSNSRGPGGRTTSQNTSRP